METKLPFEKFDRSILTKREATTNPSYGKSPEEQTIQERLQNGVICMNKVSGPTSHQVSDYVQRILKIKKAGHGGTLDPMVTGVLPIALGKATRVLQTLLEAGKEYVGVLHLHEEVSEEKIRETVKQFQGKIKQYPPVRSAVKRQWRERTIYYLNILEIKGKHVLFQCGCEAGTYMRTLCVDWAKAMGVNGQMAQLIRTKAGPFTDKEWHSLHDLKDAYENYKEGKEDSLKNIIKTPENCVRHLPKIWVLDSTVDTLCHGADLSIPGIAKLEACIEDDQLVAIFTLKEELVAIGYAQFTSQEIQEHISGKAVKTTKVFMDADIYPKFKKQ